MSLKDLYVTWCALTHTTERATHRRGARYFLPALFVDRFANFGGLDTDLLTRQLDDCRTFTDDGWTGYWGGIAETHRRAADEALARLGAPQTGALPPDAGNVGDALTELGAALAPAVSMFADRTPENGPGIVDAFAAANPDHRDAAIAVDELVKVMVYQFIAAWPGWSPRRMAAYRESRRIFHLLLTSLAPAMNAEVERYEITVDSEQVTAYGVFPRSPVPVPTVLATNGLEGTVQEILAPALKARYLGVAVVAMEMPGTFMYSRPLSVDSERIYSAVIDRIVADPRVDPDRVGMLGFSFGATWSTRMAARDHRLKAVVSNGGFLHHSFGPAAMVGMPEILVDTMKRTVGATNLLSLARRLHPLSTTALHRQITAPVLAVNGDRDTLADPRDTVELAREAPNGELLLYPGDDHCAMGNYTAWFDHSTSWLVEKLGARARG